MSKQREIFFKKILKQFIWKNKQEDKLYKWEENQGAEKKMRVEKEVYK